MSNLLRTLYKYATGKTALVGLILLLLSQGFLALHVVPHIQALQPQVVSDGVLTMVDFKPLESPEQAYAIFNLYADNILGYVSLLYATDFVLPIGSNLLFFGLMGVSLRYAEKGDRWRALLLLPLAGVPFDYIENLLALFMIDHRGAHTYGGLASLLGVVTAFTAFFYLSTMFVAAALLVVALVKFVRSKLSKGVGAEAGAG